MDVNILFQSKTRSTALTLLLALGALAATSSGRAQSSAFTYQGNLSVDNAPAAGTFDLRLTLHNALSGGAIIAGPLTNAGVAVGDGHFVTTLDFGPAAFDGSARWLQIGVRTNGSAAAFVTLSPRQLVTATPYAVRAANFGGDVADGQLSANVARLNANQTFSGTVRLTNVGNIVVGGGAGLTALNASQLTSGTLPDARLSTDVARRSGGNTLAGSQTVTNGTVGIGMGSTGFPLSIRGAGVANSDYLRLQDSDGTNRWHLSGQGNGMNFVETGVADFRLYLAPGGNVGVGTGNPTNKLHVAGTVSAAGFAGNGSGLTFSSGLNLPLAFGADPAFVGTPGNYLAFGHFGVSEDFIGYKTNTFFFLDSPGGADVTPPNVVVGGELSATAVNITSDRNAKEQFKPVNAREVLEKVSALPISEWQYKAQGGRHIGPMAQDFHAAFAVGPDERHIATVDADGVALAAIQGLHELVREREREVKLLREQNDSLAARLAEIERALGLKQAR